MQMAITVALLHGKIIQIQKTPDQTSLNKVLYTRYQQLQQIQIGKAKR